MARAFTWRLAIVAWVLCCVWLSTQGTALTPQQTLLLAAKKKTVPKTLSLDGSNSSGLTLLSPTVTLTTTKTNDVIVIFAASNGGPVISVSGSSLGAFTLRARNTVGGNDATEWYAVASGVLSSETITLTNTSPGFTSIFAFGVNGAKTSAPWDTNASLPKLASGGGASDPITVSTTALNTIVFGGFRTGSVPTPTNGAGYTNIAPLTAGFALAEYQIFAAAQTNLSITLTTGAGNANGSIGDAIVQGP